jgi:hypothetical protein
LTAAAKYDQVVLYLAEAMADRDKRPQWNQDSFFRRYVRAHVSGGAGRN